MRVTPIIKLIVTAYFSPQLHGTGSYIENYFVSALVPVNSIATKWSAKVPALAGESAVSPSFHRRTRRTRPEKRCHRTSNSRYIQATSIRTYLPSAIRSILTALCKAKLPDRGPGAGRRRRRLVESVTGLAVACHCPQGRPVLSDSLPVETRLRGCPAIRLCELAALDRWRGP